MFIRLILSLFSALLVLGMTAVTAGAVLYHSYTTALETAVDELLRMSRSRSQELAVSLADTASGNLHPEKQVILSHTMHQVVEKANNRNDPFRITELVLVSFTGELLAHNDVMRVAREFQQPRSGGIYDTVIRRSDINPVVTETKRVSLQRETALPATLAGLLEERLPQLTEAGYHVAVAVFPDEGVVPIAAIHMQVENRHIVRFLAALQNGVATTLLLAVALSLLSALFFALFSFLALTLSAPRREPGAAAHSRYPEPSGEPEQNFDAEHESDDLRADDLDRSEEVAMPPLPELPPLAPLSSPASAATMPPPLPEEEPAQTHAPANREAASLPRVLDAIPLDRVSPRRHPGRDAAGGGRK